MYVLLLAALQWLHIFFGVSWFGAVLTLDFMVLPSLRSLGPSVQQAFGSAFDKRALRLIALVASMTIVLGLIRGIVGDVLGNLGSAYGLTRVAALVLGGGLMAIRIRFIGPVIGKLHKTGYGPHFDSAADRLKRLTVTELGGFPPIFTFMIAMRFGY
jgi:uncharacterized membrane protein